jgi:hypothetical protein
MTACSISAPRLRASSEPQASPLVQRWRRQIAGRSELAERRGIRQFALVGHRVAENSSETLVPLDRLSFIAMFDDRDENDRLVTRLVGVRAKFLDGWLRIGGPELSLFDKDVRSAPCTGSGRRLDPQDAALCELALGWEQHLERVNRHPHYPRRNVLRWPAWWCEVAAVPTNCPTRVDGKRTLVALEAATERALSVLRIYADVTGLPKRQVLSGTDLQRLLCGMNGPVTFDLFHSRFRRAD